MEKVISYLEELNYRFVTFQLLEEFESEKKFDFEGDRETYREYQWLVKVLKHAADPANDKFDFNLMFGIKFVGKKTDTLFVMFKGVRKVILQRPWLKKDNINIRAKRVTLVFPDYMSIEDRKKWRHLHRKVKNGKTLGPVDEKMYKRYLPEIKNLDTQGNLKNQ